MEEELLYILSTFLFIFLTLRWYVKIIRSKSVDDTPFFIKTLLSILPILIFIMYFYTTTTLAASDVVDDGYYIVFYTFLGMVYTYIMNLLLFVLLNVSWLDDSLSNKNKAATLFIFSSLIGLSLIYAGANIGEGPGWWTVVFASFLGVSAFFVMLTILDKITHVLSRITSDHHMGQSIRLVGFILGLSLILAKASSGDWTSFGHTVVEFFIFWPSMILLVFVVIGELLFKRIDSKVVSLFIGLIYLGVGYLLYAYLVPLIDFVALLT